MKKVMAVLLVLFLSAFLLSSSNAEDDQMLSEMESSILSICAENEIETEETPEKSNYFDETVTPNWSTSGWCGPNVKWTYSEYATSSGYTRELEISGQGAMYNYSTTKKAPWSDYILNYVTVGSGVTSIGDYAFYDKHTLVSLPSSIEVIGSYALSTCRNSKFTLGSNLYSVKTGAFKDCKNLSYVSLPNNVLTMGQEVFAGCTSLTEAWLPNKLDLVPARTFEGCSSLETIMLPGSVNLIGDGAFSGCSSLQSISLSGKINRVASGAFADCAGLSDVYYDGTKSDRYNKVSIASENECLANATWHYITKSINGMLEWNSEDVQYKGTTPYVIANGEDQTPRFTVLDDDGYPIFPDSYDYEYRENKNAGTAYLIVTFKDDYEGGFTASFKIYLPPTTTTTVANIKDGIKLTWSKVEGADGYVIYRRAWSSTTDGWTDFVRWNNTTALNWTDTKVYAGTRYQYGVKAYFNKRVDPVSGATIGGNTGDNFNLGEVGPLKTTVRITTRTLNSVTAGTKQMTVKWAGSSVFTGYQIQYATNSAFTQNAKAIKISNPKTVSTVIKSLTAGKTYYVRLRSYHEFNGMTYFGEWSNVKNCKVK